MFNPPDGAGHGHAALPPTIAMGGGSLTGPAADGSMALRRHPDWIRSRLPSGDNYHDLKGLLRGLTLNTVCEEAHCPNIGECWDQRTATIMILGDTCTRACGFCAVKTGRPTWFDDDEPRRVAEAIGALGLEHVVVTSVARDDLPDGGASVFAETIRQMRRPSPGMGVEVLIPDFNGDDEPLQVGHGRPAGHPEPQPRDRPAAPEAGPQAGPLGPHPRRPRPRQGDGPRDRLPGPHQELADGRAGRGRGPSCTRRSSPCARVDCDILTIGQYLRPSLQHLPLERYYHPDEFAEMKVEALALGFKHVESAPLVRSSYHARDQVPGAELKRLRRQATVDAEGRIVPLAG